MHFIYRQTETKNKIEMKYIGLRHRSEGKYLIVIFLNITQTGRHFVESALLGVINNSNHNMIPL